MLQIAKNFEQCEKAKAVMQQAKGPTEQVNYTGTRKPSKSEQNWGQGQSSQRAHQSKTGIKVSLVTRAKLISVSIVQGRPAHPRSTCPASNKRCSKKGCGRMGHFARACRMGVPHFAKPLEAVSTKHQACHLDASLNEEYETDLFEVEVKPEKYAQSVYSTAKDPHGTRVGRTFFSHLKLGVTKDVTKSIRVQLDIASTCNTLPEKLALSLIPPGQKIKDILTPSRAMLFTYDNSKLTPMGKLELLAETTTGYHLLTFHVCLERFTDTGKAPSLVWLRLCELGTSEDPCR